MYVCMYVCNDFGYIGDAHWVKPVMASVLSGPLMGFSHGR